MATLEISIFDTTFTRIAIMDDFSYFGYTRNFRKPDSFELRINRHKANAEYLAIGNYLVIFKFGEYRIWKIGCMEIELTDGKGSEQWIVKGRSLAGVFENRLCLNKIVDTSSGGYDEYTGSVESAMKYFVNAEVVNPTDTNRTIPNYTIATDLDRGEEITVSGRLQPLSDLLEDISYLGGIGYYVYFDIDTLKFVFEINIGIDRSVDNGVNTPVLFSPNFDNIQRLYYKNSNLCIKNFAVVGGTGDGKDRNFEYVGTRTGFDRREVFVDARNLETSQGLIDKGTSYLAEYAEELIMEFQHTQVGSFEYGVDFDLGDIVTVIYPGIVEMDTRIIKIDEHYMHESGWQYFFTVGSEFPDLINILNKMNKNTDPETRR